MLVSKQKVKVSDKLQMNHLQSKEPSEAFQTPIRLIFHENKVSIS